MKKKIILMFFLSLFLISISLVAANLKVIKKITGPWNTNCYIVFDEESRDAAVIDAGFPIEDIISVIKKQNLILKYIFITHCHQDHIGGILKLQKIYPKAKSVFSKKEFEDSKEYSKWETLFNQNFVERWKKSKIIVDLMNFDYKKLRKPDIYAEENRDFKLGNFIIKSLHIPGHSRGSTGYYSKGMFFSGDLITYSGVGYLDYKFVSKKDIEKSVKRIYKMFPNETLIYLGHGKEATIGFHKKNNRIIKENSVDWGK